MTATIIQLAAHAHRRRARQTIGQCAAVITELRQPSKAVAVIPPIAVPPPSDVAIKHAIALDAIAEALDGQQWDASTLIEVAMILEHIGIDVRPYAGE